MRKRTAISMAAVALILFSALATAAPTGDSKSVTGTISRVDTTQKMLVVKSSDGNESTIYWKADTTISGDLREGQAVRIDTMEQDGKTWATSIQVQTKKPY